MTFTSVPDHAVKDAPAHADNPDAAFTQQDQDYLFDLHGYRILRNALAPEQLTAINGFVDDHPVDDIEPGDWIGDVEAHTYGNKDGVNFQNIVEGGEVFEQIIDHPTWIDTVRRYIEGGAHRLRIDENFLNVRRSGGYIQVHSGGAHRRFSGLFRWPNTSEWSVGQINILMALTDVGPGDGCTTLVPGSHKSSLHHPNLEHAGDVGGDQALGITEVHLNAGDALMFSDALCHASIPRTNPGERRVLIYRYAPHLLAARFHYLPSEELITRLTPERRRIVMPVAPRMRPGRTLTAEAFEHNSNSG